MKVSCDSVNLKYPTGQDTRHTRCMCSAIVDRLIYSYFSCSFKGNKKVKVTPVQALRLCTGRTAHRGSRGIALPFHDHGTSRG